MKLLIFISTAGYLKLSVSSGAIFKPINHRSKRHSDIDYPQGSIFSTFVIDSRPLSVVPDLGCMQFYQDVLDEFNIPEDCSDPKDFYLTHVLVNNIYPNREFVIGSYVFCPPDISNYQRYCFEVSDSGNQIDYIPLHWCTIFHKVIFQSRISF